MCLQRVPSLVVPDVEGGYSRIARDGTGSAVFAAAAAAAAD